MPCVSVLMPTYNRVWIIERAIRSVIQQSFGDWELIIVDDGSTDGTLDLLRSIHDPRLVVLPQPHGGQARARNHGLAHARAPLIAYLDTDNVWHPHFLEVMTSELRPSEVMAYCSQHLFLVEGDRSHFTIVGRKVRSEPFNPARMLSGSYLDTNSVLHRAAVLPTIGGFDKELERLLDWDFFGRMVVQYPWAIRHVDQVLCDYYLFPRTTAETLTNSAISDAQLREHFGLSLVSGDEQRIRDKLRRLSVAQRQRSECADL
jgi:glycosyltransferase involved in cell wall biosynthesis